jgi:hypothetical protein
MLSVLRRAPVVVLCLVLAGTPPVLAQAPAKGTEILWDRYGVPHILRARPPRPVLRVRLRADGSAQRTAATALRAGTGARRGVLRRRLLDRRSMGANRRHP